MEKILTPIKIQKLTALALALGKDLKPTRHCDGGNLNLFIRCTPKGTLSRTWTFLYNRDGKQREMGLGPYPRVSLAQARQKAAKARKLLDEGIDPLAAKQASSAPLVTFRDRANAYIEANGSDWDPTHLHQWHRTIDVEIGPLADMPVAAIDTAAVLRVLTPMWKATPATASRVRGRIEKVLNSAKAMGLRSGENPAAWRDHLANILPGRSRLEQAHHDAMDYREVPAFMQELRANNSTSARALEFVILTACRSGEVRDATWSEIDMGPRVWTISANRMKAGREHRVPLSDRAIEILRQLALTRHSDLIFAGRIGGRPIGKTTLLELCPSGSTVHGFRSSFRDWAGNTTLFPREIAEQALAHAIGDSTEQAYRRSDALERRRELMAAWASFCTNSAATNVIRMRG